MNTPSILRGISVVALLGVLAVNILANALPINGLNTGEVSDLYPSLFTPAGITFSIWSVIYVGLIGFEAYVWTHGTNHWIDRILPWSIISCVLNISWILAWHYLLPALSVIIMLALLATLLKLFLLIREKLLTGWREKVMVSLPFTLYFAWICVATIANISALLISFDWDGGFLSAETWTICMMAVAAILATKIVVDYGTPAFILVVMWALFGIYLRWHDSTHESIWIAAIVIEMVLAGVLIFIVSRRKPV